MKGGWDVVELKMMKEAVRNEEMEMGMEGMRPWSAWRECRYRWR